MRYLFILCCRWYHPEGEAARRGETVDYDPLRLAILADEQACDRMDLPHDLHSEGAEALLMARQGWLHEVQADLENRFDLELAHGGFDDENHIVDILSTHDLPDAQAAEQLAQAWRAEIIKRAGGQEQGVGGLTTVEAEALEDQEAEGLYQQALRADPFQAESYRFQALAGDN